MTAGPLSRAAQHRVVTASPASRRAALISLVVVVALASCPLWLLQDYVDKLTTLFIYVILAVMWNALAGYSGQVSVGQQAFFGLSAYASVKLSNHGLNVYLALGLGVLIAGAAAYPLSRSACG
jgi:branched-chain amino acid transport system permease protein